jgi:hypothetical protein
MAGLIAFQELEPNDKRRESNPAPAPPPMPEQITMLRDRILNPVYCDSMETRLTVLCELVYQTYTDLVTRKRFY